MDASVEIFAAHRRPRRTARVFVFSPEGEVLLIRCEVDRPDGPYAFWLTPGGEIEDGETPRDGAVREIQEELGLTLVLEGPIFQEENVLFHEGVDRQNTDFYFATTCPRDAPVLAGVTAAEIAIMKEMRWWGPEALKQTTERIFPVEIVRWIDDYQLHHPG